jgi:hypothetical protein
LLSTFGYRTIQLDMGGRASLADETLG